MSSGERVRYFSRSAGDTEFLCGIENGQLKLELNVKLNLKEIAKHLRESTHQSLFSGGPRKWHLDVLTVEILRVFQQTLRSVRQTHRPGERSQRA